MEQSLLPDAGVLALPQQKVDLALCETRLEKADALPALEASQARIERAQRRLWANRKRALLLVFQGLDASGKDGTIRRLAQAMDPLGVNVIGFGVPDEEARRHDFFWRVWRHFPARGEVTLFNRSHYEAVLIERQLAAGADCASDGQTWDSRYRIIRDVEQHLVSSGTVVLKFWLHVSAQEQRLRLRKRLSDPEKQWKFSPADVEAWQQREQLLVLASDMIRETHCDQSPWHLVPADDKSAARRAVADRVASVLEVMAGDYPPADDALLKRYGDLL